MTPASCRFCSAPLRTVFADLGMSPLANSYVAPERAGAMEPFYPLCALVCGECMLVQLEEFETPEAIFSDYAYFSSYSDSSVAHAGRYADNMIARLGLGRDAVAPLTVAVLARPGVLDDVNSAPDSHKRPADEWSRIFEANTWASGDELRTIVGDGPLITDDRPLPEYFILRRLQDPGAERLTLGGLRALGP